MRKALIFLIVFLIVISFANAKTSHYYEIKLKYNRENITLDSLQVKPDINGKNLKNIEGGYVAEIISFDEKVLNLTFFDFPLTILYDTADKETGEINGGGMIELNETETTIKIPYFENAKEINIYDMEINKKLRIDVSPYSKGAISKKDIVPEQKQTLKENPKTDIEKQSEWNSSYAITILILIILAISLTLLFFIRQRKIQKNQ